MKTQVITLLALGCVSGIWTQGHAQTAETAAWLKTATLASNGTLTVRLADGTALVFRR